MVNEGAKILEEGIAIRGSDIDVVWVNGYGWPRLPRRPDVLGRHGRPGRGVGKIAGYHDVLGGRHWDLSPLLARLAAEGGALHQYAN